MQSHMNMPITLEQALEKHPNVVPSNKPYVASKVLPSVISKETYRIIDQKRLGKSLNRLMDESKEITSILPNIFTTKDGVASLTERGAYDWRIRKFRKKDPATYYALLAKLSLKIKEIKAKELELAEVLADIKEATNLSFERNSRDF